MGEKLGTALGQCLVGMYPFLSKNLSSAGSRVVDGCFRPPVASSLSGVSYEASCGCTRKRQLATKQISDRARPILDYRSRFLSRASPRALAPTQIYTPRLRILGGVGGFRMLDGLKRSSPLLVRKLWGNFKTDPTHRWGRDLDTHQTPQFS